MKSHVSFSRHWLGTLFLSLLLFCCFNIQHSAAQPSLVGDAVALPDNCFQLTDAIAWQTGGVWMGRQLDLNYSFVIDADVFLGNFDGADGAVFVLQSVGCNALGDVGEAVTQPEGLRGSG